jgi:Flp pilus assembly protein TadD
MVNLKEKHMARQIQGFTAKSTLGPKIGLFVSTAVASLALAGCTASAPPAEASFAKAQAALENGKIDNAIMHAEAAVLAEPRNPGYRALLGASYLEAGRFESAATAFGEALELGEDDPRTVLSYALAKVATGDNQAALAELSANQNIIPPADLGLALALAGQPDRGAQYLVNAVRQGENSPKARQNLAYAYALAGNWRAARVMAAEDVPADQLDARLSDWAANARPEDYQIRVASLLGVSPAYDAGQPQHLALANFPEMSVMVAEAEAQVEAAPVQVAAAEAPARVSQSEAMLFGIENIDTAEPAAPSLATIDPDAARFVSNPVVQDAGAAPAPTPVRTPVRVAQAAAPAPAPAASAAPVAARVPAVAAAPTRGASRFVSNPVVQNVPAAAERVQPAPVRAAAPAPQQRRMAVASGSSATHLIQLGSFNSREVAEQKWGEFKRRFPDLADRDVIFTEALVNGRTYFRVAAAGFGSRSARSMCNTVKSGGVNCFAYAASSPPAGAVDRGVRVAAR